ncbi:MAG: hypothetical protein O7D32_06370, partial [bacterium]|nr:hypothetical protein [bacterium]
ASWARSLLGFNPGGLKGLDRRTRSGTKGITKPSEMQTDRKEATRTRVLPAEVDYCSAALGIRHGAYNTDRLVQYEYEWPGRVVERMVVEKNPTDTRHHTCTEFLESMSVNSYAAG